MPSKPDISNKSEQMKIGTIYFCTILIITLVWVGDYWIGRNMVTESYNRGGYETENSQLFSSMTDMVSGLSYDELKQVLVSNDDVIVGMLDKEKDPQKRELLLRYLLTKKVAASSSDINEENIEIKGLIQSSIQSKEYYSSAIERFDRQMKYLTTILAITSIAFGLIGYKSLNEFRKEVTDNIEKSVENKFLTNKIGLKDIAAKSQGLLDDNESLRKKIEEEREQLNKSLSRLDYITESGEEIQLLKKRIDILYEVLMTHGDEDIKENIQQLEELGTTKNEGDSGECMEPDISGAHESTESEPIGNSETSEDSSEDIEDEVIEIDEE